MSEEMRATHILRALHSFFNRFADAWAEGCAPDDAVFPYITYAPTVPGELERVTFNARVWYRSRQYEAVAALVDAIDAAIGPGCRMPAGGGAIWVYKGDRFMQLAPVREDPDLKCALLSLALAANTR